MIDAPFDEEKLSVYGNIYTGEWANPPNEMPAKQAGAATWDKHPSDGTR